eukprot:CAMPEP_0202892152 /NCGR_PEP_ID=MMETSP1392-20130828/1957_1 /ASSEMBLY_ACC=CAM_ASM_000868 /TAXON_ID=225041 /ORGANISM="Chlamydomonas chlamydogama, Strain SAG 11-48b" /LENGTH=70 /DNA_ID=CAMNT_0049576035 /DNA_START=177 /DNA_END=389 /DNA_ORIENTATION=+
MIRNLVRRVGQEVLKEELAPIKLKLDAMEKTLDVAIAEFKTMAYVMGALGFVVNIGPQVKEFALAPRQQG